jgi:hypothetical protein
MSLLVRGVLLHKHVVLDRRMLVLLLRLLLLRMVCRSVLPIWLFMFHCLLREV